MLPRLFVLRFLVKDSVHRRVDYVERFPLQIPLTVKSEVQRNVYGKQNGCNNADRDACDRPCGKSVSARDCRLFAYEDKVRKPIGIHYGIIAVYRIFHIRRLAFVQVEQLEIFALQIFGNTQLYRKRAVRLNGYAAAL